MTRPPVGGMPKRYKPLFGSAGKTVSTTMKGISMPLVGLKIKSTPPVKKPKAGGGPATDPLAGIFGLMDQASMEQSAHASASAAIAAKAKAIDAAIQAEKSNTAYNTELMKGVWAEFAQFIQSGAGAIQNIYGNASKQTADFTKGMLDGMNAATGQVNAANNQNMAGIGAPPGQYTTGDFGASAHIQAQAQNFGDLLAAQGANWAAYMAVQPGIYSKMAVYQIGKMLQDSTRRLALLEAQKVGLSDEEAAAYADALGQLQKDQYNRRVDYLKYQQSEAQRQDTYNYRSATLKQRQVEESNKNKRFVAGLEAAGLKTSNAAAAKAKTLNAALSRETGYLTYNDGTYYMRNGKPVKVQGKAGTAQGGTINITASKAAGKWVDGHGNPVPGMQGVPVPKNTPGGKAPTGVDAREKDWAKFQRSMVGDARALKTGNAQTGAKPVTYEQAFAQLTERYGWWVNRYGVTAALKKRLRTRLNNKIKRVLAAVGLTPSGSGGGGNAFTGG